MYTYGEFIGRDKDLKRLNELLNDRKTRNITIRGSGGIGKTALAFQAIKSFNSGRVLVQSLAGNPSSSSVMSRIAGFLKVDTTTIGNASMLKTLVIQKMRGNEPILLYFDNMEDTEQVAKSEPDDRIKEDAIALIQLLHQMPDNVKVLATSSFADGQPNEENIFLNGLEPKEGMEIFRKSIPDRLDEVEVKDMQIISRLANGHPLSIRLLGGSFNDRSESLGVFSDNLNNKVTNDSVNTCIQYTYDYLDKDLKLFLSRLRLFKIPITASLMEKALKHDSLTMSADEILSELSQRSWLDKYNPILGHLCPDFMKKDTEYFMLHPRIRDFLDQPTNVKDDSSAIMEEDKDIQFYTALCYGIGFGVPIDLKRQVKWCTLAAKNGHVEAQLTLAEIYEHGAGEISIDQKMAHDWYLEAAKNGDKGAQKEVIRYHQKECERWNNSFQSNANEPLKIKHDITLPCLHRAAECNQMALIRSLLKQTSANVNAVDKHGRTPLYIAAENGYVDLLKLLGGEFNANVNVMDSDGRIALYRAAERGHLEAVKILVAELRADTNCKSEDGKVLLHYLAHDGHIELVRQFLTELEPSVNTTDNNGQTPLHRAAANGHVEIVKMLVDNLGAEASCKDRNQLTPLLWAVDNEHIEVVTLLFNKLDANEMDNQRHTLLIRTTDKGLVKIMRLLVSELGADANAKDDDGRTLLHRATDMRQIEIVKLLVDKLKANTSAKDSDERTLLHLAAENEVIEVVTLLLAKPEVDVDAEDNEGWTPLHWAADHERVETMRLLVTKFRANVNAKDKGGWTPLHHAAKYGRVELMEMLVVELRADINAEDIDGKTPLHRATEYGRVEATRLLVAKLKAEVNAKDNNGMAPLHQAVDKAVDKVCLEIIMLLVAELDAEVNVRDNEGQTPLHLAVENKCDRVITLLMELSADVTIKDNNGRAPIHRAADNGYIEGMRLLMDTFNVDENVKDNDGRTLFHRAIDKNQIITMRYLINRGVKDKNGWTMLCSAVISGNAERIELLMLMILPKELDLKGLLEMHEFT